MIEFFDPPDAPAPGAFSRATRAAGPVFGVPTAAKVAFACIALGPDGGCLAP